MGSEINKSQLIMAVISPSKLSTPRGFGRDRVEGGGAPPTPVPVCESAKTKTGIIINSIKNIGINFRINIFYSIIL